MDGPMQPWPQGLDIHWHLQGSGLMASRWVDEPKDFEQHVGFKIHVWFILCICMGDIVILLGSRGVSHPIHCLAILLKLNLELNPVLSSLKKTLDTWVTKMFFVVSFPQEREKAGCCSDETNSTKALRRRRNLPSDMDCLRGASLMPRLWFLGAQEEGARSQHCLGRPRRERWPGR